MHSKKNKKCDETVKNRDEQARGVKMEGEMTTEDTESTEERFGQNFQNFQYYRHRFESI